MLIKITCNNCGDISIFDKEYMTPKRKKCFDCYMCRNNNKEYTDRKRFLKNYDSAESVDLNKYFGRHKGFTFENIKEEENYGNIAR